MMLPPLTNNCAGSPSLVLERLPSGHKYWSVSPRTLGSSSPLVGLSNLSHSESATPRDCWTEENEPSSDSAEYHSDSEEFQNGTELEDSVRQDEGTSPPDAPSGHIGCAADVHSINGPTLLNEKNQVHFQKSADMRMTAEKLEHLLVDHKKEVDELRKKHEFAVSELLKDLSPEMRCRVLRNCSLIITDEKLHFETSSAYDSCRESM